MLKIKHPGAIVREREKKVNNWESVRSYKYANGAECQILVGFLPHGHAQSVISANRTISLEKDGDNLNLVFSEQAAPMIDFLNGDRPTAESSSAIVLDPCGFVPTAKVEVAANGVRSEAKPDGANLVASFEDGTTVTLQPHGGHAHVAATKDGKPVKTFFNGQDNTLYAFGLLEY